MDLGISGLASGFDWKTLVDQLADVERAPQKRLRNDQAALGERNNAYGSILTQFSVLKNRVDALKDPTLFEGRLGKTSDATIATASASAGSALGSYVFNITQLATTSVQRGGSDAGRALNSSNDVSGLLLSAAPFRSAVTAGTFTVNGKQVTLATSDTLGAAFDKIASATGGVVTAGYDPGTDLITLSSSGTIVLGSAADTSNFLQVTKLENNGTNEISSTVALGTVQQNTKLNVANLATTLSDGGSGAGQFKVNGVSIAFSASTDTMADVLARINSSTAGVVASYDAVNDRFQLANKSTGDLGVALQDVTGNFLAATRLSSGTLSRGNNLRYTINGGDSLTSHSNAIGQDSSSIPGLTVTALGKGSVTIETTSDTARIRTAINDFLAEYNRSQSLINSQTASTTDAKGKVTAGTLAGDPDASELSTRLRRLANGAASGLAGTFSQLAQLGINSNGTDDTITLADSAKLDDALAGHLGELKDLFSNATGGLAVKLSSFLNGAVGDSGSVVTKQDNLVKQSASVDAQVIDLERIVQANRSKMVAGFLSMEQAQSNINQQLKYLSQRFGA